MYFKYRETDGKGLAILEAHALQIVADDETDGYLLVPDWDERKFRLIDAAVSRLAALCVGLHDAETRSQQIRRDEADEFSTVFSQMSPPYLSFDCIAWYETIEEANSEMEKIAEAIARGDRLYDLTKRDTDTAASSGSARDLGGGGPGRGGGVLPRDS